MWTKDKTIFKVAVTLDKMADWLFQKCSDEYLEKMADDIDKEIELRMSASGATKITIYHVIQGPIHRDSIPDDEGVPDGLDWLLEVKARLNDDPSIVDIPLWVGSLDEAREIVFHFYDTVEPKVIYI